MWIYDAFIDLQSCRPIGQIGFGRIPWTAIDRYVQSKGIADSERFEALIRALDDAQLKLFHEKVEKARNG